VSKPSDLLPELQGRFPIRVELGSLTEKDFVRILTEPKNALIIQYKALLATEGVDLVFEDSAISQIAKIAGQVNERAENIGPGASTRSWKTPGRRVFQRAGHGDEKGRDRQRLRDREAQDIVEDENLSRYIL